MADIHILSTMAVQRAMKLIEPGFTAFSGCTLRTEFASTAALRDRIQGGESADVAILTEEWIAGLCIVASWRREWAAVQHWYARTSEWR